MFSLTQTALASPCNTTQGVLPVLGTSFPGSPHPSHPSSWCPLPSVPVIAHTLPWVLFLLCQLILHPLCASVSSFAPTTTRILSLLCMLSLCGSWKNDSIFSTLRFGTKPRTHSCSLTLHTYLASLRSVMSP